jgi:hypothetical protein
MTRKRRRFYGIPLDTRRDRRWAAALAFFFPVFYFLITFGDKPSISSFGQVLIIGGLLGGFGHRGNAPIKTFEDPTANDEYDIARRDAAHYTAYKFWRRAIVAASSLFFVFHDFLAGEHFAHWHLRALEQQLLEALIVPAAMAFLILPQAILLWTERDVPPEDDLSPDTTALSLIS